MASQPAFIGLRQLAVLALILVVNGAIISAVLFASSKGTTVSGTYGTEGRAYQVTFQQVRACERYNFLPWGVTMNGLTEVQPSNQSLPLPNDYVIMNVPDQNLTRITFSVTPGIYNYTVVTGPTLPGPELFPRSGTVQVTDSDVVVYLDVVVTITC